VPIEVEYEAFAEFINSLQPSEYLETHRRRYLETFKRFGRYIRYIPDAVALRNLGCSPQCRSFSAVVAASLSPRSHQISGPRGPSKRINSTSCSA
jgi:hypothetical protein